MLTLIFTLSYDCSRCVGKFVNGARLIVVKKIFDRQSHPRGSPNNPNNYLIIALIITFNNKPLCLSIYVSIYLYNITDIHGGGVV